MFTKCPECNISFRVTAKVLQQANGNVRCGGCSHAFNALNYLSEEMPSSSQTDNESNESDQLAETSRRLLETLDELAGPDDILIEDTGVEWRVLDKLDPETTQKEVNATEEMRYDDSTLLPDDFGEEDDDSDSPAAPGRRATDHEPARSAEFDAAQQDLHLSEPEEWTDLLEEVRDSAPVEIKEEDLDAIRDHLSTPVDVAKADFGPADIDSQFGTQAEAMGLDIVSSENALTDQFPLLDEDAVAKEVEHEDVGLDLDDFAAADESISEDDEATGEFPIDDIEGKIEAIEDDTFLTDIAADSENDDDTLVAAADDDEDEIAYEIDTDSPTEEEESIAALESTAEFQSQIDEAARALDDEDEQDTIDAPEDDEQESIEAVDDDDEVFDDQDEDVPVDLELEGDADEAAESAEVEHIVPPPTAEEMTINQEIDQEMMAAAVQDDDFAATLVGLKNPEQLFEENAESVETIVMEGEFIRGSIEEERLAAEHAAKSQLDDPASLVDTYAMRRGKVRGGRRRYDPASYGMTAAIILLALALAGQFIHYSRESLATMGLFNQTIAPVYRMLGSPVTPSWDIRGWQFEATNGSVNEADTTLTIVSRIVNRAEQELPYPLVHVSLTDRWEEIMGSRILEPGDYLAGDLNPSIPVLPGENFTAVIAIENPSADATGFKLNVCYRVSPGTVRCAIEDFKN